MAQLKFKDYREKINSAMNMIFTLMKISVKRGSFEYFFLFVIYFQYWKVSDMDKRRNRLVSHRQGTLSRCNIR